MADLSHWNLAVTFTGREAAYLLMGIDPSGPDAGKYSSRHTYERLEVAYDGAIKRAMFEGYVEPCFPDDQPEPDNLMPDSAVLRSVALWQRLEDYREYGDSTTFTAWLGNGDLNFVNQRFTRFELSRWLSENSMKSVYQFDVNPSAVGTKKDDTNKACLPSDKPLSNRERDTLLAIIAVLCKEAKIPYDKPAKAAGLIQSTATGMGVSIGESTIEGHLKKIPDALATRMK